MHIIWLWDANWDNTRTTKHLKLNIVSSHGNGFCIAPFKTGRGSYIMDVVCDDEHSNILKFQNTITLDKFLSKIDLSANQP